MKLFYPHSPNPVLFHADPSEGLKKYWLKKLDKKRYSLIELSEAPPVPICLNCRKYKECVHRDIAETVGYVIARCDEFKGEKPEAPQSLNIKSEPLERMDKILRRLKSIKPTDIERLFGNAPQTRV
ncbi:hypothetical protein J7L13_00485 [bacterium]|nr:hypothetical protein [bacterium]